MGYSDFHELMGFTGRGTTSSALKTFVGKFFLDKSLPANLHSTSTNIYSYMYSMTPKYVCSFLACEYSEFKGFCPDFEYVGIIVNQLRESYLPNTSAFLAVTFCSHIFRILPGMSPGILL